MFFFFDSEDPESTGMDMSLFESIKHINEYGQEYWEARELQPVLEYRQWRQFSDVIAKAMEACEASDGNVPDHFADVRKIVKAGATSKPVEDFRLSRYACYLSASKGRSCQTKKAAPKGGRSLRCYAIPVYTPFKQIFNC